MLTHKSNRGARRCSITLEFSLPVNVKRTESRPIVRRCQFVGLLLLCLGCDSQVEFPTGSEVSFLDQKVSSEAEASLPLLEAQALSSSDVTTGYSGKRFETPANGSNGLQEIPSDSPVGGVTVDLDNRFGHVVVAEINADGDVELRCEQPEGSIEASLDGSPD